MPTSSTRQRLAYSCSRGAEEPFPAPAPPEASSPEGEGLLCEGDACCCCCCLAPRLLLCILQSFCSAPSRGSLDSRLQQRLHRPKEHPFFTTRRQRGPGHRFEEAPAGPATEAAVEEPSSADSR